MKDKGLKMSYTLSAVISTSAVLNIDLTWLSGSRVVPLEQGLVMIPVTAAMFDHLGQQPALPLRSDYDIFHFFPTQLAGQCARLSRQDVVAYVEAEFWGGVGEQHCVVWRNGAEILGPLNDNRAINQALRLLGVNAQGFFDEFEAVGLGRHRATEEWLGEGRQAAED